MLATHQSKILLSENRGLGFVSYCGVYCLQTHVEIGTARGVAKVVTRDQDAPQCNVTEVRVTPGATPRCTQVHCPDSSGAQSMDSSRSRQHT